VSPVDLRRGFFETPRRDRDENVAGMNTYATGTFEIETWEEEPYDEQEGTRL
jgi:hypothetical protein